MDDEDGLIYSTYTGKQLNCSLCSFVGQSKFALERQKTFNTDRECSFHRKDADYGSTKLRRRISHRNSSFDPKSRSYQRYKFEKVLT